jgi:peptidoglycan/xylan/chitin deacetylase (PgdA/CDA1 family)
LYHEIAPNIAEEHFSYLNKVYNLISLKEYITCCKTGKIHLLPKRSLIVTIDDGYKSNYDLLPKIKRYKIPVTIFLTSSIINSNKDFWFNKIKDGKLKAIMKINPDVKRLKYLQGMGFKETDTFKDRVSLSKNEIKDMSSVVDFQSHSQTHPILPFCPDKKAKEEIFKSKDDLEEKYNLDVFAFSYPGGYYSERDMLLVKEAGYDCALTVDSGYNSKEPDFFRLRRISISDTADMNELIVKVSGFWGFIRKYVFPFAHGYIGHRRINESKNKPQF